MPAKGLTPMVTVEAPARLHLGFLDLGGDLGRRFVSLGLTLEHFAIRIGIERADEDRCEGFFEARAATALARLREVWDVPPVRVAVEAAIPEHAGLGSGTQLDLAVGVGVARLLGRPTDARGIGALLTRGARSGIGVAAFEAGGFILDGGKAAGGAVPPLLCRLPFPAAWRVILVLDGVRRGLSGEAERAAFRELPAVPPELCARLCRLAVVKLLPAVAEADLAVAGDALGEIQRTLGDHFAPAQGGRYTSPEVAEALGWLEAQGIAGVGQTSWGPTGFALVTAAEGAGVQAELAARHPELGIELVEGRNRGAEVIAT